jgi:hypothetical protein
MYKINRRSAILGSVASLFLGSLPRNIIKPTLRKTEKNSKLRDLYISPEALEDIRNWNVNYVDEIIRKEIFTG